MKKSTISIVSLIIVSLVLFGVIISTNISVLKAFSSALSSTSAQNTQSDQVIFDLKVLLDITTLTEKLANKKLVWLFLKKEELQLLDNIKKLIPEIQIVLEQLLEGEQRWVFIFQNNNELRATGGFMGSYALIEINQGKITAINTEDIYDADGQFTGYFEAPVGVLEYLSSGNGLRLPDANWYADTGKSAEHILPFFALGNKQNIKGIIFVNLEFAKKLLTFLGPIELSDYNTIVTQDNVDEVLRSRRDAFFPGSIQKKHMLSQLLTQVKLKVFSLEPDRLINLVNLVTKEIQNHNLQFYSNDLKIDQIFSKYTMRQTITIPENSEYIYLLESNVGINKANKGITREVILNKQNNTRTIIINFLNNNKKPTNSRLTSITNPIPNLESTKSATQTNTHLAYVNYQRVLVPKNWELVSVEYQNDQIKKIDEEIIEQNGLELKQIGFLIVVQEEEKTELKLTFTTTKNFDQIYIQKQPGLPTTKYILEYNQKQSVYEIKNNIVLSYP